MSTEADEITHQLLRQIAASAHTIAVWVVIWSVLSIVGAVIWVLVIVTDDSSTSGSDPSACSDSLYSSLPACD